MADEQKARPADAQELTHEEICNDALEHYEKLASECHDWYNVVPKAIEFYKKAGGETILANDEKHEHALKAEAMLANKIQVKVIGKLYEIIQQHAWVDRDGGSAIRQENYENLQLALANYITPLLRKAGWYVDEDDGMLTCAPGIKENHIYLRKKTEEERVDYIHMKLTEWQLKDKFNSDKMRVAIATLRLLETNNRLTLAAVREIALKALDDIASIGNPELEAVHQDGDVCPQ